MEAPLIVAMVMQRYRLDLAPGQTEGPAEGAPATTSRRVGNTPQSHQHRYYMII